MNFILVHYKTEYTSAKRMYYYNNLDLYHDLMIWQISNLYANEKFEIHVITDVPKRSTENIIYHSFPDLVKNNHAKLNIFGLLDKPAMYLDNDIILMRKFEEKHLPNDSAFSLYQGFDIMREWKWPSFMYDYTHYNSGMVWIPKPDKEITKTLFKFKDIFTIHEGGWANDEFSISFFVHKFNMKMPVLPEVSAYRKFSKIPLTKCQSIHYAGFKELFLPELKLLKGT